MIDYTCALTDLWERLVLVGCQSCPRGGRGTGRGKPLVPDVEEEVGLLPQSSVLAHLSHLRGRETGTCCENKQPHRAEQHKLVYKTKLLNVKLSFGTYM